MGYGEVVIINSKNFLIGVIAFFIVISPALSLQETHWWKINEGSGTNIIDYGTTIYNSTAYYGSWDTVGAMYNYYYNTYDSSGVSKYIDTNKTANQLGINTDMNWSLSFWFYYDSSWNAKINAFGGWRGNKGGIFVDIDNSTGNEVIYVRFSDDDRSESIEGPVYYSFKEGWNLITYVYNADTKTLKEYVNSTEVFSGSFSGGEPYQDDTENIILGNKNYDGTIYDGCPIQNVRIIEDTLSADEINWLYNDGNGRTCSILYYPNDCPTDPNQNATQIFDNSTSHFFEFNTTQNLNFTAINSSGDYVPQLLTIKIDDLEIEQNFTAGEGIYITFNNESINNYTVFVYNPFNTSVNLTSYFITAPILSLNLEKNKDNLLDGEELVVNAVPNNFSDYSLFDPDFWIQIGNLTEHKSASEYILNRENISGWNQTINININLTLTYSNESLYYSNSSAVTYYKRQIDDCSNFSTVAYTFKGYDEGTLMNINTSLEANFMLDDATIFAFTSNNKSEHNVCIYPSWANFTIGSEISFSGTTDEYTKTREYYLQNAEINNISNTINLYCLKDSESNLLEFDVEDDSGISQSDVYVLFKRWYEGEGAYREITKTITDSNGHGSVYLRFYDTWYQVDLYDGDGNLLARYSKQKFTSSPITLTITDTEGIEYITRASCVTANVYFANSTRLIVEATDNCGLMTGADILVEKIGILRNTIICNKSIVAGSITTYCDIGNESGNYYINVNAIFGDEKQNIYSDYIQIGDNNQYSQVGLFGAFLLIGTLTGVGLVIRPQVAGILAIVGIGFSYALGFLNISWSAVVSIGVLGIIAIVVMKR